MRECYEKFGDSIVAGEFGIGNHSTVIGQDVSETLVGGVDNTTIIAGAGDDIVHSDVEFGDNLLKNGSFEDNGLGNRGWALFNHIPGWSRWGEPPIEVQSGKVAGGASDGDSLIELDSNGNGGIYQFVRGLDEGEEIRLSFDFAGRVGVAAESNTIEVWWSGVLVDTITAEGARDGAPDWENKTYVVEGSGSGRDWIAFKAVGTSDSMGGLIDAASVQKLVEAETGGNDMLAGEEGDDELHAGAGRDWLEGGEGADMLDGGADSDTAYYANSSEGVHVDLEQGAGQNGDAEGDTYKSIENAHGSDHDDILIGDDQTNRLIGRDGEDYLSGGGGKDFLLGGSGADVIDGGEGDHDTAEYDWSSAGVTVNLTTGEGTGGFAEGDRLINVEHIYGSRFDDTLTGDENTNRLVGFEGDDVLDGRGGKDVLIGGAGADTLIGGEGNVDVADYQTSAEAVNVDLANGGTTGDAAGDTYIGVEVVYGSALGDTITGDAANNRLVGNDGNDVLNGGEGNDYLLGGLGDDEMTGGAGRDVYLFEGVLGHDTVTDFEAGSGIDDRIWFRGMGVDDMSDLNINDVGDDTVIDVTGFGSLTLTGISSSDLVLDDFIF